MWGIELVRCGDRIGEHINRFDPQGKYAELCSKDYTLLDVCRGVTNVTQHLHRATVSFTTDEAGRTCFENVVVEI